MKLAYILLAFALLMPLAFSAPANGGNMHFAGESIDLVQIDTDQTQEVTAQASEKVFVGSIESNKDHYPDCRWAKKILPEHEIWFSSTQDAQNHGYVACKVCSPP